MSFADSLTPFFELLASTPLSLAMRDEAWLYPLVEIAHLIGLALVVGSAAMFDLRLLGVSRQLPVTGMALHLLPWARGGFALSLVSGVLLFLSDPVTLASSFVFRIKLALIALASLNALVFHRSVYRGVSAWDSGEPRPPARAKIAAAVSLTTWIAVVAAGRLIAYL